MVGGDDNSDDNHDCNAKCQRDSNLEEASSCTRAALAV